MLTQLCITGHFKNIAGFALLNFWQLFYFLLLRVKLVCNFFIMFLYQNFMGLL